MAKRKRASRKKPSPAATQTVATESNETPDSDVDQAAQRFVGQWQRLISTTNWEKGRIICQWREALMTAGAAVTEYSDEAWSQLVASVTSQHVGRLRRVFQRFGDVYDQYEGLYWSHFQAALDWDDAEMWLEGAIQNEWSVSQMRGKRWETLGTPSDQQQAEIADDQLALAESADEPAESDDPQHSPDDAPVTAGTTTLQSPGEPQSKQQSQPGKNAEASQPEDATAASAAPRRTRLNVDVAALPDDLAEAFESFKLSIIAHRREGWRETSPESVVECLEALKELTLAEGA